MPNNISKEHLASIKNYFIITQNRSGSTMLASMLNMSNETQVITEENTRFLLRDKYLQKIFNNQRIIDRFIDDFYFLIYLKINTLLLPQKENLKITLRKYSSLDLKYDEFVSLLHLQFNPLKKDRNKVRFIVNKEVNYHFAINKLYKNNPETKFVFLVRNCLSNTKNNELDKDKKRIVSEALDWKLKTKHFIETTIPNDAFSIVLFEDLIKDQENTLKNICAFYNIPFNSSMLNYRDNKNKILEVITNNHKVHPKFKEFFYEMHGSTFSEINENKIVSESSFTKKQKAKINIICKKERSFFGYETSEIKWKHYFYFSILDIYLLAKTYLDYKIGKFYFMLTTSQRIFLRSINFTNFLNKNNMYNGIDNLPKMKNKL